MTSGDLDRGHRYAGVGEGPAVDRLVHGLAAAVGHPGRTRCERLDCDPDAPGGEGVDGVVGQHQSRQFAGAGLLGPRPRQLCEVDEVFGVPADDRRPEASAGPQHLVEPVPQLAQLAGIQVERLHGGVETHAEAHADREERDPVVGRTPTQRRIDYPHMRLSARDAPPCRKLRSWIAVSVRITTRQISRRRWWCGRRLGAGPGSGRVPRSGSGPGRRARRRGSR